MAMLMHNNTTGSSNQHYRKTSSESARRSNTQASAYVVNAATMALSGFHFSTCGGGFEVGMRPSPSPPPSPDSSRPALAPRARSGDAAYHITEHCERMFCETLKAVFLVEKDTGLENSLVMDVRNTTAPAGRRSGGAVKVPSRQQGTLMKHDLPTPSPSPDARKLGLEVDEPLREYVEVWDYACDARFTGFVAEREEERALFVFFDKGVMDKDLKPGLVALLELASSEDFDCTQLVICLDRNADTEIADEIGRGLSWAGFELMMLDHWAGEKNCISDRWMFMGMDV